MKWFSLLHYCLAAVIVTFFACTKTTGPDPLPQNRILSFKVVNLTDTVIYGAIDDIDNTITVYIPFYYGLTVIDPRIEGFRWRETAGRDPARGDRWNSQLHRYRRGWQ